MQRENELIKDNITFLRQGIDLLENLADNIYRNNHHDYFQSGIGKHFRHVLDHYIGFSTSENRRIDYDHRERDYRLETDRYYAMEIADEMIKYLENITHSPLSLTTVVEVKCNEGCDNNGDSLWSASTIKRELGFLISHTIHHYAIIALLLRIQGVTPPANLGIAPSTLKFQDLMIED